MISHLFSYKIPLANNLQAIVAALEPPQTKKPKSMFHS